MPLKVEASSCSSLRKEVTPLLFLPKVAFALDTNFSPGGIHLVWHGAPDGSPCIWGSSHSCMSVNGKFIFQGVAVESLALHNNILFSHHTHTQMEEGREEGTPLPSTKPIDFNLKAIRNSSASCTSQACLIQGLHSLAQPGLMV